MEEKVSTRYANAQYYGCNYALVLDKRHQRKGKDTYPLAMRFTIDRKHFYHSVDGEYTEEQFTTICNLSKKAVRSDLYAKKEAFDAIFEKYKNLVERLGASITLDKIRIACTGVDSKNEASFIGVWEEIIDHKYNDNNKKHWTTGEKYDDAIKSFKKLMGEDAIVGFKISAKDIQTWKDRMYSGIAYDGQTYKGLSDATVGMHLRVARLVWNTCVERGYLVGVPYPFSDKEDAGKVPIPKGNTRKHEYLPVDKMTELYEVFRDKKYPESWGKSYIKRVHYSLGLFLAQYLCNGFNLVDAGLLEYNRFFFQKDRKAFLFIRKKTKGRSKQPVEVIVPIIDPLQYILDELAAEPKEGARVFPDILKGCADNDEVKIRNESKKENSNVQDRVKRVCEEVLHWEVFPSGTWCRHSFATNLTHAGIDRAYVSESMGHTQGKNTTDLYIDTYPIEIQMQYNQKLLNLDSTINTKKFDVSDEDVDLDNMSPDEMKLLLRQILKGKKTNHGK